ncbi:MAG TPA: hypothetical protein VHB79_30570 [Polyangiaceae bacterium]|nr:hypothetical protein [Polyangiaceae bacterium]
MGIVQALAGLLQLLSEVGAFLPDALELLLEDRLVERAGEQQLGQLVLLHLKRC